ncbi:hypothetical protein Goshw_023552, partial [Gossypium schwendimanii]|nr:hypothetical protein [Gossypium schwendimanii]
MTLVMCGSGNWNRSMTQQLRLQQHKGMPSCLYPTYITRAVGLADSTSKRLPDLRSDRHISFCNKFRATKQSTPSLPWGESLVEASNHR